MSTVTDIRLALIAALEPLGVEVRVIPGETVYDRHGFDRLGFVARVIVGPESEGSEAHLDWLISGPDSVPAQLADDDTLGGLVGDLVVTKCSGYQRYATPNDDPDLLGAEWTIETRT